MEDRLEQLVEEPVPDAGHAASFAELMEMRGHLLFRARDLDRLDGAQHFAKKAAHAAGGRPARLAVLLQPPANHVRGRHHDHQRDDHRERDKDIDPEHDHDADNREEREGDQVVEPHKRADDLVGVVTEAVERLAGRLGHGTRARIVEDAREQVLAHQAAGLEHERYVCQAAAVGKDDLPKRRHHHQRRQPPHPNADLRLA
ncbi:MAG: hypothetical protein AVDCRST_MAG26-2428 [uncultured Chloroflexia bacterium]|uniref:Uncharacterized protein n=1 Tax=uncultured Chloroflexia bacterium TaxID=1672391 RepID=A0A6J4IVE0_9CHLR|nr:MAG: hypothetical protein AVDCRST_MAG26-2428 [uncultured Chloroflexia bacterium]